eukprot:TRINITY_DN10751_c0_g1_i2.p1 TRINITY_DN10751_c0_g1~~TRINITY_DN10751_c0_g1_i2.p1  ORF type:complete len:297 (-),score=94.39 TRINITY_DN10751_c0_g1_i2:21-911(-)
MSEGLQRCATHVHLQWPVHADALIVWPSASHVGDFALWLGVDAALVGLAAVPLLRLLERPEGGCSRAAWWGRAALVAAAVVCVGWAVPFCGPRTRISRYVVALYSFIALFKVAEALLRAVPPPHQLYAMTSARRFVAYLMSPVFIAPDPEWTPPSPEAARAAAKAAATLSEDSEREWSALGELCSYSWLMLVKAALVLVLFSFWLVPQSPALPLDRIPLLQDFTGFLAVFLFASLGADVNAVMLIVLGFRPQPAFVYPFLATSPANFWGKRWNTYVHGLLHRSIFVPLLKCDGFFF